MEILERKEQLSIAFESMEEYNEALPRLKNAGWNLISMINSHSMGVLTEFFKLHTS
jgi:hypothetical protein